MRTLYTFEKDGQEFYADDAATDEGAVEQVNARLKDEADEGEEPPQVTAADITKREPWPDWEDFGEKYRPVAHTRDAGGAACYIYDPHIPEHKAPLDAADLSKVWTITHGDSDVWTIAPGVHIVNRVGYVITERPCDDEAAEYLY